MSVDPWCCAQALCRMQLPEEEQVFLRDLVKASRQRIHSVHWVDRDGSNRITMITAPEAVRLNAIAGSLKISKGEALRQAAHIPVPKPVRTEPATPPPPAE
jgi:hypothetical protein